MTTCKIRENFNNSLIYSFYPRDFFAPEISSALVDAMSHLMCKLGSVGTPTDTKTLSAVPPVSKFKTSELSWKPCTALVQILWDSWFSRALPEVGHLPLHLFPSDIFLIQDQIKLFVCEVSTWRCLSNEPFNTNDGIYLMFPPVDGITGSMYIYIFH